MAEELILNPGDTFIEKFRIDAKVAQGSLGDAVYKAQNLANKRQVFIRILPKELTSDQEFVDRFFQEIKFTSFFNHPNILKAAETGKEEGCYYFVTSFSNGKYLDKYLAQNGKMNESKALSVIRSLADALGYAWKNNKILHRNLGPSTILITSQNEGVLTDFGLAKRLTSKSKQLTMAGATVGNPAYMSPEQFEDDVQIDCRSDIYCLGLLFYQILTGKHPFEGKSTVDMIEAHMKEEPQAVTDFVEVTDSTVKILEKMLKKDRGARYENWDVLMKDVDAVLNEQLPPSIYDEDGNIKQTEALAPADNDSGGDVKETGSKGGIVAVIIIILLLLLAGGGAAAYFLLVKS